MPHAHIETHDLGITWVMHEALTRTSHALVDDGRVWLVDPVDDPVAMEAVAALGAPAAVIQLLDRHERDCAVVAERLGVPYVRLPDAVPDSPLEAVSLIGWRRWKEVALWWPQHEALIVAEAVGTNPLFAVGAGAVGVHPMLRLFPPKRLGSYRPRHLLVGHGPARHGSETGDELVSALAHSRRDIPRLIAAIPKMRGAST